VDGAPLLYLDQATFDDATKNVRGGAPVLFPSPGKLAQDLYSVDGRMGALKQHGFARNTAFDVVEQSASSVKIAARATAESRLVWPWDFTLELAYTLTDDTIRIGHVVTNESPAPMPFGFGFHPYFQCSQADKAATKIPTAATRAFDNVTKKDVDVPEGGIDLTAKEVDLHLHGHGGSSASLILPSHRVRVDASAEYGHWVVWTLSGKDFVCLEPWTAPGNALNTGAELIRLAPGEARALFVAFTVGRAP
jgi:galactose mutarotase-like enzyme